MVIRRRSLVFGLSLAAILTALLVLGSGWGAGSAKAQEDVTSLALDMDPTNGSGPCNPVDGTHGVNVGDTYQVAICLTNAPGAPSAFQFDLIYSDNLDQCVPTECAGAGCLDGNPDANAGTTTWGGTALGEKWDCNVMNAAPPTCDVDPGTGTGHGNAFLECLTLSEEPTLSVGSGVSTPVAMLTFNSVAKGTDTMKLENVEVDDAKLNHMVLLFGEGATPVGTVAGGTVSTEGTFPTSTAGPSGTTPAGTAPANATPGGDGTGPAATAAAATAVAQGTPLAAIDQAATATSAAVATKAASGATATPGGKATPKPGAASEGGGSSGPNAALIGGIVIGCVIVVGGMGWFAYRRLLVS